MPPAASMRPERTPGVGLADVVAGVPGAEQAESGTAAHDPAVRGVTHDSRQVRVGDLYAALAGENTHGARFVEQAVERGAVAVLTDAAGQQMCRDAGVAVPVVVAPDPRQALGGVAGAVYGHPSQSMLMLGVTGTNGKTTTCALLDAALQQAGHTTGVVGTIETRVAGDVLASARTTPEATDLHALLALMRERGVTACAMEVSSHGLELGRVNGIVFDEVGFTNLTQDHLDFHGDMESYYRAKASLFGPDRSRDAVVCVADRWGRRLAAESAVPTTTLGEDGSDAAWTIDGVEPASRGLGTRCDLRDPDGGTTTIEVSLAGDFNATNAALAFVMCRRAGLPAAAVAAGLRAAPAVPGRMEPIDLGPGHPYGVVDYAHTPDAIERALLTLRPRAHRLVVVLGAGGDRDAGKRPHMGAAAAANADVVVVTDDNPRSEDPTAIRRAVLDGARAQTGTAEVHEVPGRAMAIDSAVSMAAPGDVVLLVGKGHEAGQTIGERTLPFDDRVELRRALAGVAAGAESAATSLGEASSGDASSRAGRRFA